MIRFWAELWRLWRTRHENPVLYHAAPWRRGRATRVFWFLWITALGFINFEILFAWPVMCAITGGRPKDLQVFSIVALSVLSLAILPLSVLIFSRGIGGRENIESLALTLLPRPVVAFGAVYWAVVVGLLYMATTAFAYMNIMRYESFAGLEWEAVVWVGILICWQGVLLAKTVQRWFSTRRAHWLLLFTIPVEVAWNAALVTGYAVLVGVAWGNFTDWRMAFDGGVLLCLLVSALVLVWAIRAAGFLGGEKLFSAALPEDWQRRSWWAREVATRAIRHAYPDCGARLKALRRDCLRRWWLPALSIAGCAWLPLLISYRAISNPEDFFFKMLLLLPAAAAVGAVVSILSNRGWSASRPPAILSGRLVASTLAHSSPGLLGLVAPFLAASIYPYFSNRPPTLDDLLPLLIVAVSSAAALTLLTVLWVRVLLPARGTKVWSIVGVGWSLAMIGCAVALAKHEDWATLIAAIVGGTGVFLLLFFASATFQRLHDSEVLNIPAGQLSTEATPDPDGPVIPDDLRPTMPG